LFLDRMAPAVRAEVMEQHRAELAQMQRDAARTSRSCGWRGDAAQPWPTSAPRHRLRVALFGTPAFALPTLDALHARHDVAWWSRSPTDPSAAVARSRRRRWRARARAGLPLAQPERLRRDAAFAERLAASTSTSP
jgi:hypothetical protein